MLFCLDYRLREPVNYVRANWIRPEDLHHYESLGFHNFKIVERNTPVSYTHLDVYKRQLLLKEELHV